jgi:hypothetical protein
MALLTAFTKISSAIGSPNMTENLSSPINLDSNKKYKMKVQEAGLSSNICNIFNINGQNNGLLRLSNNGGSTWYDLQISNGIYQLSGIANLINSTLDSYGWWKPGGVYGFTFSANTEMQIIYFLMNSSLLKSGSLDTNGNMIGSQLGIQFDYKGSLLYQVLGYNAGSATFTTDGTYAAPNIARIDYFGNTVSVLLDLCSTRIRNGIPSNELLAFNLASGKVGNMYYYPISNTTPYVPVNLPNTITSYSLKFVSSQDLNQNIYLLSGSEAYVTFEIVES